MNAREYMSPVVQTVSPRSTLKDVAQILFEHDCGMVPVVDKSEVKGVLTDRDVAIIACNHDRPLSQLNVADVLEGKTFSCAPGDDLTKVLGTMASHRVRRLLVLGDEGLEGVVSFDDLARAVTAGKLDAAAYVKALAEITGAAQHA